jgi:hypothetical protein
MNGTTWMRAAALVAALCAGLPASAGAQWAPLAPGTRVRVVVLESRWPALFGEAFAEVEPTVESTVVWATPDSLGFPFELEGPQPPCSFCPRAKSEGDARLAYRDLIELQVSEVVGSHAGPGLLAGAVTGGLFGVLSSAFDCLGATLSPGCEAQVSPVDVGIGALVGGTLGWLIGSAKPRYGPWTYVSLDAGR